MCVSRARVHGERPIKWPTTLLQRRTKWTLLEKIALCEWRPVAVAPSCRRALTAVVVAVRPSIRAISFPTELLEWGVGAFAAVKQ